MCADRASKSSSQWPICTIGSRDTAGGQGPQNRRMVSADSVL